MAFLAATGPLSLVLCLLNLVLTLAIIRRIRTQEAQRSRGYSRPEMERLRDQPVPDFTATTIDGRIVDQESLVGQHSVVGFFTPGCSPCHEQAPAFAALGRTGRPAYAFIAADHHQDVGAAELCALVAPAEAVVVPLDQGLPAALGLRSFPAFLTVDASGVVRAANIRLDAVLSSDTVR